MEADSKQTEHVDDEEEYVLLDLGTDCGLNDIRANTSFVISGLDTLNPILTINGKKLIGEYQETIGTCLVFSKDDGAPTHLCGEAGPSEANVPKDSFNFDPNQAPSKRVKLIDGLHKILKFRLATEDEIQMTADGIDIDCR